MSQTKTEYVTKDNIFDIVFGEFCACSDETEQVLNSIIEQTRALPIEDVVPVIHAKWLAFSDPVLKVKFTCYCSNCNEKSIRRYPYCPGCGAKMDGE